MPKVFCGTQEVKFPTKKAMALFAYLVVEPGSHPREKLQAIFWPESDTNLAGSALRNTLSRIKASLQDTEDPLLILNHRIGFNGSSVSRVDLDQVIRASQRLPSAEIAPPLDTYLHKAGEAAKGPFLEAFTLPDSPAFDDWVMFQRTIWAHRLNLVYEHLTTYQLEQNLIEPAIQTVNRWLSLDPLNETAHRRLMHLYFLSGERTTAIQVYETCRSLLARNLGNEPSQDTEDLFAHIRSSPFSDIPVKLSAPIPNQNNDPFTGRTSEYKVLVDSFQDTRYGNPKVVVISGDSGIGKSRLAQEFSIWAGTEQADILRGNAHATTHQLPYQPIIDALRERLERENAPEDLLDDAWLVELTTLLPELRERYPDLSDITCDETTARSRLFEAVNRLGQALSNRKTLVIMLDDMQGVDYDTLELLNYLTRNWHLDRVPILLLLLVQADANQPGSVFNNFVNDLDRSLSVTQLHLEAWAPGASVGL